MTDDPFRRFTCWSTPVVQGTLFGDIAALGLDADAVFLAAHTSLVIDHLQGVRLEHDTEAAVLHALTAGFHADAQNTLIAVTGPSGSGKSHLVRWVRAHLSDSDSRYELVYIPKAIETLRQLLGHILDQMPGAKSEGVKAELDKAVGQKRPEHLAANFLNHLTSVLEFELSETRDGQDLEMRRFLLGTRVDADSFRREGGLAELLRLKPVREHFLRPGGAVAQIIDSIRDKRQGDEDRPEFSEADFPTRQAGVTAHLRGSAALQLWTSINRDPAPAVALLNEGRDRAVAETLGMRPGLNMAEVFRQTRERLRQKGNELVLLFEDLAQFGLFDGDLYDHFAIQSGEDLAPIRALFAITDAKFEENVPDTVQTRLTHHFSVAPLSHEPGEVPEEHALLIAKYLNVARVGRDRLIQAWEDAAADDRESGDWIPNACFDLRGDGRECPHREICWSSFGDVEEIGLYPYNQIALRRELQTREQKVTPRTLVDESVKGLLIESEPQINNGTFPTEVTKGRFDFSVTRPKETIVPSGQLEEAERDRLHRARVIWADGGLEQDGITVAFDLPETVEGPPPPPAPPTPPGPAPSPEKASPLEPLYAWQNGTPLPEGEATWYRETLADLVKSRVDLLSLLLDPGGGLGGLVLNRAIAPNSFELENAPGRPAGPNRLRFTIRGDDKGVLLLSAVRWWWDHGHWITDAPHRKWDFPQDAPVAQVALDEFLGLAVEATEGAVTSMLMRGPLDPASAAVAIRVCARLAIGLDAPTASSELDWVLGTPSANEIEASDEWGEVASSALAVLNDIGPGWIRELASARQGETGDPLCVDSARLVPVVTSAIDNPIGTLQRDPDFDDTFSELAEHWRKLGSALQRSTEHEADSLRSVLDVIYVHVAESDFRTLIESARSAAQRAADNRVFRPVHEFGAFSEACDRLGRVRHEELNAFLEARERLDTADASRLGAEIMKAQAWAAQARRVGRDLDVVARCLAVTAQEVTARLSDEFGESPEKRTRVVREKIASIATRLESLAATESQR